MARPPARPTGIVLGEARRALLMSQAKFGEALGASHRTAVRWDAGQSSPGYHALERLARLLYPAHRTLAEEVARAMGKTLESLGIEASAAVAPRPAAAVRPQDLVGLLVLTAVEQSGAPVSSTRAWLRAVFARGCELGLTMEIAEAALRPAPVPYASPSPSRDAVDDAGRPPR